MPVDHSCPVAWAADHGLLEGSPVEESWCLSDRRESIAGPRQLDAKAEELLLWRDHRLSVYYTPFDWVNTSASVMLVGITPGAYQAAEALRAARRCLLEGQSNEASLRTVDAEASFGGPMRTHLVQMLDDIGLQSALGVRSCDQLFSSHHHLGALVSAIDFPVYVNGKDYGGSSPDLRKHPVLRSLVRACLGARVQMVPARSSSRWERRPRLPSNSSSTKGLWSSGAVSADCPIRQARMATGSHPSGKDKRS